MKTIILRSITTLFASAIFVGGTHDTAAGQHPGCYSKNTLYSAYGVYYHNSGTYPNCSECKQDYDLDLPEYVSFKNEYGVYPNYGTPLIADYFGYCYEAYEPHGDRVHRYYKLVHTRADELHHLDYDDDGDWDLVFQHIADTYGRGTVVNLSADPGSWKVIKDEVLLVIDEEVIMVGANPVFANGPVEIKDKVVLCKPMDARGVLLPPGTLTDPNIAMLCAPTNWDTGNPANGHGIAHAELNPGYRGAWDEAGSYSTPMVTGVVHYIANVVAARDNVPQGDFIKVVLDYVFSSCDRENDPGSYERRSGALESYGPWSYDYGYGLFSAWKAMIYAYGYGELKAKDIELENNPPQGFENPPTVFSDHFCLRGDLLVPASQTFRVNSLATVSVDSDVQTGTQEGPELGELADHPEIHVLGDMEVETSLEVPGATALGVNATITIGDGGTCTIKNDGTITISPGQYLDLADGSELVIEDGGILVLNGDLVIEEGATLTIYPGATVLVASTDSNHDTDDGIDPDRIEIIVKGSLVFETQGSGPIVFQSSDPSPGVSDWYGIRYLSEAGPSTMTGVTIKNAYIPVRSEVAVTVNDCTVQNSVLGVWSQGGATVTNTTFSDLNSVAIQIAAGDATVEGVTISNGGGIDFTTPTGETGTFTCHNSSIDGGPVEVDVSGSGHNTIDIKGVTVTNESGVGISICLGSSGSVDSCTVSGNAIGIALVMTSGVTISHCSINNNTDYGIYALFGSEHTIFANTITGSTHGIYLLGTQDVEVEWNSISGNTVGVSTLYESNADLGGGSSGSSGNNSITNNSLHHVGNLNMSTTIMAENNWWGSVNGPHPTKIAGSVDYDPWLTGAPGSPPGVSRRPIEPEVNPNVPVVHALRDAYPNPFNPATTIAYEVGDQGSYVDIRIFDTSGRLVRTLVDENVSPGAHSITWDGTNNSGQPTASGIYFVRMTAQNYRATRKIVLLK